MKQSSLNPLTEIRARLAALEFLAVLDLTFILQHAADPNEAADSVKAQSEGYLKGIADLSEREGARAGLKVLVESACASAIRTQQLRPKKGLLRRMLS